MRVLIIDDDAGVVAALRRSLRVSYIIDVAASGAEGLHAAEVSGYDAIILDLGLPDVPGLMVCQAIRGLPRTTPILVLTATVSVGEKVRLLNAGADDYLTKPFSIEELTARLRVLVRRDKGSIGSTRLSVGDLTLDSATREVERGGQPIFLRRKEFDLLEYLMHHQGIVVTRAMIADHIWAVSDNLWTNAIEVHIKCLRDKIDRPFASSLIKTVHGVGYRLDTTVPEVLAL